MTRCQPTHPVRTRPPGRSRPPADYQEDPERSPGPPSPRAWTAFCWLRRSSRWYREWYPWPLSVAGTSRSNSGRLAGW